MTSNMVKHTDSDGPKALPIRNARTFADPKSLTSEINAIDALPAGLLAKKGLMVRLFKEHGLFEEFLDDYWPYGKQHQHNGPYRDTNAKH